MGSYVKITKVARIKTKKMRLSIKLLILFVIFVACFELSNAKRGGGGRGGGRGGSRGSNSRGSSYGGSSTRSRSNYAKSKKSKAISTLKKAAVIGAGAYVGYKLTKAAAQFSSFAWGGGRGGSRGSSYRGSSTKSRSTYSRNKKSKAISTLKKAAVIGAGAYYGYKLTKTAAKFSSFVWGYNSQDWSFNDWNSWRQADGFLCRNDNDCNWLNNNLECQPVRDFGWSINSNWFGGNSRPVGECGCNYGFEWDDDDLECEVDGPSFGDWLGDPFKATIIIFILIAACCCCGIFCFFVKKFFN